jgi:hypothetical protein
MIATAENSLGFIESLLLRAVALLNRFIGVRLNP